MDPRSKVELLTHHARGGHGGVEASGMVFFLQQGAETGTSISSLDRNRDGGGIEVGFEKRAPPQGFMIQGVNIDERGGREVAPTPQAARWRDQGGGARPGCPGPWSILSGGISCLRVSFR